MLVFCEKNQAKWMIFPKIPSKMAHDYGTIPASAGCEGHTGPAAAASEQLAEVMTRSETEVSNIRGKMGTKWDSRDGPNGYQPINLQLVDAIYPCSQG